MAFTARQMFEKMRGVAVRDRQHIMAFVAAPHGTGTAVTGPKCGKDRAAAALGAPSQQIDRA